jgi:dsDNA-specific endonuclease/ATPase MutS2
MLGTPLAEVQTETRTGGIMSRFTTASVCLSLALAAVGCNKAADEQRKADQARAEADQKVADANRDASDKINAAQAEADKKVADAQASFLKMREDYRHKVNDDLTSIDKDIANLEAKAKTATGKTKANIDAALPNIHSLRESVTTEYRSLELASAVTWDDAKGRVDKAVDELKKAIDKAD